MNSDVIEACATLLVELLGEEAKRQVGRHVMTLAENGEDQEVWAAVYRCIARAKRDRPQSGTTDASAAPTSSQTAASEKRITPQWPRDLVIADGK